MLRDTWKRTEARLEALAPNPRFRVGVAVALVCLHLMAFAKAGHERLGVDFNNAPGEAPYYSDPDARALGGWPRQPHHWSRLIVSRWDAQHYIGFATRGLTSCPTDGATATDRQYLDCGLAWLPAYGKVGGVIADVLHAPPDYALLGLSVVLAILLNFLWTSRTIVDRLGAGAAYGALIAFNAFPTGFFIVTPYPEGATILLMLTGFLCLANDRWILAGLAIGAGTALRPTAAAFAVALGCAAVYAAWTRRKAGTAGWWRPLIAIPISIWGQLLQTLILKICVGDGRAYLRAHDAFAGGAGAKLKVTQMFDPEWYVLGFTAQHLDSIVMIASFAMIALAGREVLTRFKRQESIFLVVATAVTMIMPLAAITGYWGLNRYFLLAPLTFLCAGVVARKHTGLFILWLVLSLALYWNVELCSYISHGDPHVCHCLGRVQVVEPWAS